LKRSATQLSDARWGFETTSSESGQPCRLKLKPHHKDSGKWLKIFSSNFIKALGGMEPILQRAFFTPNSKRRLR